MARARGWCCDLGYSPVEIFAVVIPDLRTLTARGIPTFPELGHKKKPQASRGLSWRRKTSAETKRPAVVPASPHHTLHVWLAVAALVGVRREQPSAVARLSAVDTISLRRLAVLGLLGLHLAVLLAVLRIHRGVRHLSLGYDAGELSELGVGDGAITAITAGPILAILNAAMAARSMIFMVSLLIFRPRLSGSGVCSIASSSTVRRSVFASAIIEPLGI